MAPDGQAAAETTTSRSAGEGSSGRLLVVGTGLIGTSIGLAAGAAGYQVFLSDMEPERLVLAESVGAGTAYLPESGPVDLAVVAVPPTQVAQVVDELIRSGIASTLTHVSSIQHRPQVEIEALQPGFSGFVGSHPIAGRERSGPHHASAELFRERPWVVCPTASSSPAAVAAVSALAGACGAIVSELPSATHDVVLARLSHLPQLLASALAGSIVGLDRAEIALAGTGLKDTSRIADSDPDLWAEIVSANPDAIAAALDLVLAPLAALRSALAAGEDVSGDVRLLVERGRSGRDLLAGKHGEAPVRWATVSVVVPDEPGRLARLLGDAAAGGVNVEDIRVDHSPGQPLGIVELDVAPGSGARLESELADRGWRASASEPIAD